MSADYVCRLDAASLRVAETELNEDPKERLSQVQTLREWVSQQKHLAAPTDTDFLLKFLRTAKFSQLRAREVLEGYLRTKTKYPDWMNDIDSADTELHDYIRTGYSTPIPQRDENGRKIIVMNVGAMRSEHIKRFSVATAMRALMLMTHYHNMDENTLVNGFVIFEDFSSFSMKHMTFWGMDTMKKMPKIWEGNVPGRFKALHFFNPGPIFETIMAACKPLFSKKMQDRFHVHGKNMEEIYKEIPQKYFPDEYLPDDYKGPNPGTTQDILENLITELKSPAVRERILHETSSKWFLDQKLKPSESSQSFRKLNVD